MATRCLDCPAIVQRGSRCAVCQRRYQPFRTVDLKAPCPICHHPGVSMRKDGRFKLHLAATPRSQWFIPETVAPDSPLARVAAMVRAERDGIG